MQPFAGVISGRDIIVSVKGNGGGRLDYATLAEWRYQIRRFLGLREAAARALGVEPQQYLLLLQVKGLEGRRPATIGALAERLHIRHHSAVELVDRLVARGMVVRRRAGGDRRQVVVALRQPGERVLRRLALSSLTELRSEAPELLGTLRRLMRTGRGRMTAVNAGHAKGGRR
jgi:DNA-binding MarR family transcriptional regulator